MSIYCVPSTCRSKLLYTGLHKPQRQTRAWGHSLLKQVFLSWRACSSLLVWHHPKQLKVFPSPRTVASFYFYFCWYFTKFLRLTLNIRCCFSCCLSSETTGVHHHLLWSSLKERYAVEMRSPETPALASFVFNKHLLLGNPACPACQLLPQALSSRLPAGFPGWMTRRRCGQKPSNTDCSARYPAGLGDSGQEVVERHREEDASPVR